MPNQSRIFSFSFLCALLFASAVRRAEAATAVYASREKLALNAATPNRAFVPRFGRFQLTLALKATYDNPFDPGDIDVYAVFTSPQKKTVRVNGFLSREYSRRLESYGEQIEARGAPHWEIRFAPDVVGSWTYRVFARDRSGTSSLPEARLTAFAAPDFGFVQISRANPRAFSRDEKPFFPIGENLAWSDARGTYAFDEWLQDLGANGANWARLWMSEWHGALEWTPISSNGWKPADYQGLGVYALDNAWRADRIFDEAQRRGVSLMLCLDTYGQLSDGGFFNEGSWKTNPYNAANGGPCQKPEEFWTNPTARKLYRRKLRYLAARYGWRSNLFAWEFWNEARAPAKWVAEMARYLRGDGEFSSREYSRGAADPFHHLLSTTYGDDAIWRLPQVDFTMTHFYGDSGNVASFAPIIANDAAQFRRYAKPHLMAEFGIDWRSGDEKYDPEGRGIQLHNALWASAMSGNGGGAMIWYWDSYVAPKKLYPQFAALRRFADQVPWTAGAWRPLMAKTMPAPGEKPTFADLKIVAAGDWGKAAQSEYSLTPSGIANQLSLPQFLYGPDKAELRTTPIFRVNYPRAGLFTVRVNSVSTRSRLQFLLDGKRMRDIVLDAAPPADASVKPEYESTVFQPEWKAYRAFFNREYSIPVPAGAHSITLQNVEGDWASLSSITLHNYRDSRAAAVNLYGMTQGRNAILWVQNAAHNWKNVADKKPLAPLRDVRLSLALPDGNYAVEWWDTARGEISRRENHAAKNGALLLAVPSLEADVAARLTRK